MFAQGLLVFVPEVTAADAAVEDFPRKEFVRAAFAGQVEVEVESQGAAGGTGILAGGEEGECGAAAAVCTGEESLQDSSAQGFDDQFDIPQSGYGRAQPFDPLLQHHLLSYNFV